MGDPRDATHSEIDVPGGPTLQVAPEDADAVRELLRTRALPTTSFISEVDARREAEHQHRMAKVRRAAKIDARRDILGRARELTNWLEHLRDDAEVHSNRSTSSGASDVVIKLDLAVQRLREAAGYAEEDYEDARSTVIEP